VTIVLELNNFSAQDKVNSLLDHLQRRHEPLARFVANAISVSNFNVQTPLAEKAVKQLLKLT
jgi:hypothetical protein